MECVRVWQAYEKPTPCETCRPKLLKDSQPYLSLYDLCGDQLLVGPSGAIGLNYLAVEKLAIRAGVPEDEILDFYEKVRYISTVVINEQHKDAEAKRKKK